jgi:hypothetical protein
MITTVTSGPGITVSGGSPSLPYITSNPNNPIIGMIRLNSGRMEVFDGTSWLSMSTTYSSVSLDQETQDLLQWARAQRTMAMRRLELAQKNPALLKALEAVKRAEENFDILSAFVEHDNKEVA